MRLRSVVLAVGLACALAPAAQAQYYGGLQYNWSLPVGDTKDFVDNDSWIGLALDGQWLRGDRASIGFVLGWNELYQRTSETIVFTGGAATGDQYRHFNIFPLLLSGRFLLRSEGTRPYVGLGAGGYWIFQRFDFGQSSFSQDDIVFGVMPEIGVLVPMRSGAGLQLSARYHVPFSAGDWIGGGERSWQYLSIGVGVMYER